MKVLVTGVKGQLGYDVVKDLEKRGHQPIGVDRDEMDLMDNEAIRTFIMNLKPEAIIHCAAIDLILHKGKVGEVYNVGGHNERTNLEVVKTILKALNKPESLITYVKDRPGHDLRYAIDPQKLENELGWKPTYNFDTGIQQTIEWYLNNKQWWENIISGEYQNYFEKQYGDR